MSLHHDSNGVLRDRASLDRATNVAPRSQPASGAWTNIPPTLSMWHITRDVEVQFADGSTAVWPVDPMIGFHEIDMSALRNRPVRVREPALKEQRTRTHDFLPT